MVVLPGHVPSKKNQWRPRSGGIWVSKEVSAEINSLIEHAQFAWRNRKPLKHPNVEICFYVLDRRSDRDNKLSCILDVLQKAGVIENDSISRFNGTVVLLPAVVGKEEKTEIVFR